MRPSKSVLPPWTVEEACEVLDMSRFAICRLLATNELEKASTKQGMLRVQLPTFKPPKAKLEKPRFVDNVWSDEDEKDSLTEQRSEQFVERVPLARRLEDETLEDKT